MFTKGNLDLQAATFDLDDTLYDNLPVIMNAGHRLPLPLDPRAFRRIGAQLTIAIALQRESFRPRAQCKPCLTS